LRRIAMNSRERVLTALNHKEPDKVPIDLGATIVTAPTRIAYQNLRAHIGLEPDPTPKVSHRPMDTVYPTEDFYRRYGVDFRPVYMKGPWEFEPREMSDDSFYDEFNVRWKKASYYYDAVERPLADYTLADLDRAVWPDPYDAGRVHGLREEAKALYENTDYAIVADIMCGGPFEQACMLRGYEQFCVDLYWDTQFAEALLDKITETDIALWDAFLTAVGNYVQVVCQGDDVGMQTKLYISPEMYRKFIKPRQKQIWEYIHSRTAAKVFYHSCGAVYDVIPDFIEIGVDILNPIQRSAAGMDLARLKQEFGDELCFWGGGIDVQQVLPFASLEEIEQDVTRTIEIMAPGGGYVFFPSHNIQADVTPDRFHKVFETAIRHRGYPRGS
jgi:uroporphyrinogen decarboxylase